MERERNRETLVQTEVGRGREERRGSAKEREKERDKLGEKREKVRENKRERDGV